MFSSVFAVLALIAPVSITLLVLIIEALLKWNAALLGCVQPISSYIRDNACGQPSEVSRMTTFIDGKPSKMNKVYLAFFNRIYQG